MFSDLSKVYNLEGREEKVVALRSVSLAPSTEFYPIKRYLLSSYFNRFSRGEFVMIRGPSGGGKTTLLNLIGTIDSPSDGELYIMN